MHGLGSSGGSALEGRSKTWTVTPGNSSGTKTCILAIETTKRTQNNLFDASRLIWANQPRQARKVFFRVWGRLDSPKTLFLCRAQPRQAKMRFLLRRRPAFGRAACEEKSHSCLSRFSWTMKQNVLGCRGYPKHDTNSFVCVCVCVSSLISPKSAFTHQIDCLGYRTICQGRPPGFDITYRPDPPAEDNIYV